MFNYKMEREPIHPGEILKTEFLDEMNISQVQLSKDLGITFPAVNEIVHGKRGISIEMAFKLAKYFNMSPDFWLNMQLQYEMHKFWHDEKKIAKLDRVKQWEIKEKEFV